MTALPANGPLTRDLLHALSMEHTHLSGPALLTRDEMCEGMRRLAEVHDHIGHPPAEVMALLKGLLIERDAGAARVLRWLRTVEGEART